MPREHIDMYFIKMLDLVSSRSTCPRRNVGAIIVDARNQVLSTGYNGVPRGFPHCEDTPCPGANDPHGNTNNCYAVHAEQNALLQCTRLDLARTLYTNIMPCFVCAKLIANTGIDRVVYLYDYADLRGAEILRMCGVTLSHGHTA